MRNLTILLAFVLAVFVNWEVTAASDLPSLPSQDSLSPGGRANLHGQRFEDMIATALGDHGFETVSFSRWTKAGQPVKGRRLVTRVPYTNIYGGKGRTEFLLIQDDVRIRIEAKWLQSRGSIDEKLPFLFLNVLEAFPEHNVIIVIDGPGWRDGAIAWLRRAAAETTAKTIRVMSLGDFLAWANTL